SMRKGLLVQTRLPVPSCTSISKSPVVAQRRPSILFAYSPGFIETVAGNPSTAMLAFNLNVPSTRCDGLPHLSSPLKPSLNGSPFKRSVGRTALLCIGDPATTEMQGCTGNST